MREQFIRTGMLLGEEAISILSRSHVAVFGVGGVGGYAVEALARSGVGTLDLIDCDKVSESNINRQIIATHKTVGMYKVDAAEARVLDINPEATVRKHRVFFCEETEALFDFRDYDYVIDAIDTVSGKLALVRCAETAGTKIISSMGAGNKLDPTKFEVEDIYKTSVCPLARVMRHELKRMGIKKLKVVYSKEMPVKPKITSEPEQGKSVVPGSCAFVPSVAGLIIAGEVVRDLTGMGDLYERALYVKTCRVEHIIEFKVRALAAVHSGGKAV